MSTPFRERPEVSVLIVHWNTPELLTACLDALSAAAGTLAIETIVVDNGSEASRRPRPTRRLGLRLIQNATNRGFAAAANQAARAAEGRYLLLLNTDVVLAPGAITKLRDRLASDASTAAVAPVGVGRDGRRRFPGMRFLNPLNHAATLVGDPRRRPLARRWGDEASAGSPCVVVDWASASTLLVRAEVFSAVAGFDEGYFFYEEDEDLCWRLSRRGYRVVVATDVLVADEGGASTAGAGEWPTEQLYRGQLRFVARRFGAGGALVYRLAVSTAMLVKAAAGVRRRPTGAPVALVLRSLWTRSSTAHTAAI